jgi:thiol-disulfide isomerase/thioredoxin
MNTNKVLVAAVLAIAIGAPIAGLLGDRDVAQTLTSTGVRAPFLHWLPTAQIPGQAGLASLESANEWLNSPPLTASALHGKVVLVDFWTYTCINWLRTLPYVRAWAEKYRDQGLVVIGVHAPEFAFEKNADNVRRAVKDMRIDYPIAVDNEHVIWRAFKNQYWPALYFFDSQGRVRHHHFGGQTPRPMVGARRMPSTSSSRRCRATAFPEDRPAPAGAPTASRKPGRS